MSKKRCAHVLKYRKLWKDIGTLERTPEPHTADLVRRYAGDVASIDEHTAGGRL